MEDKDVEKLLKDSADKIKMKDFSERWEVISKRMQEINEAEGKEEVKDAVLVTNTNGTVHSNIVKKRLVYSVCGVFLFIAICLSVVLPVCLLKNKPIGYLDLNELNTINVSESEFYDEIDKSELTITDFSDFEIDMYSLSYGPDNLLVGGFVELFEEQIGVNVKMRFYSDVVLSNFNVGEGSKEYSVNGYKLIYKTESNKDIYSTKAKAIKGKITYELDCLSVSEDIESFFEILFV